MTPEQEAAVVEAVARAIDAVPTPLWRFNKARYDGTPYEVIISDESRPIDDDNPLVLSAHSNHEQAEDAAQAMFDEMRAQAAIAAYKRALEAIAAAPIILKMKE